MRWSRAAFRAVTPAYVAVLVFLAVTLPDRVPMHFDGAGNADSWGSRTEALVLWTVLGVVILGGGALLARYATGGDGTWLNLPHKDYWLAPERREAFRRRFESDMLGFIAWTGLLLIVLMLITGRAADNGGDMPGWVFWAAMAVYLVGTGVWLGWLLRRYRPPEDPGESLGGS